MRNDQESLPLTRRAYLRKDKPRAFRSDRKEVNMPKYKLCPRCELNYIPEDEEYCGVCKAELKIGPQLMFAIDDEGESSEKLCPVCNNVYIPIGEDMCDSCKQKSIYNVEAEPDDDKDDSWREFLDDDEKDEIIKDDNEEELLSFSEIEKEEAAQYAEEEEEDEFAEESVSDEPDDFEYLPIDEKDFEEDDEEEEEDEDEEDEDENF